MEGKAGNWDPGYRLTVKPADGIAFTDGTRVQVACMLLREGSHGAGSAGPLQAGARIGEGYFDLEKDMPESGGGFGSAGRLGLIGQIADGQSADILRQAAQDMDGYPCLTAVHGFPTLPCLLDALGGFRQEQPDKALQESFGPLPFDPVEDFGIQAD